jgi:hypothetical protein
MNPNDRDESNCRLSCFGASQQGVASFREDSDHIRRTEDAYLLSTLPEKRLELESTAERLSLVLESEIDFFHFEERWWFCNYPRR